MSYNNKSPYVTRFIELSMSSDQTISSSSATLVNFDTIRGDSGHGVSLVSGENGRFTLSANRYYHIVGNTAIDKNTASNYYSAIWYNDSGSQLSESQGAFRSFPTYTTSNNDHYRCLNSQLLVNPTNDTNYNLKVSGAAGVLKSDGTSLVIIEMSLP